MYRFLIIHATIFTCTLLGRSHTLVQHFDLKWDAGECNCIKCCTLMCDNSVYIMQSKMIKWWAIHNISYHIMSNIPAYT